LNGYKTLNLFGYFVISVASVPQAKRVVNVFAALQDRQTHRECNLRVLP
jgi:hypothetical protein